MLTRAIALLAATALLSGCVLTPRIEIPEHFSFDYVPPTPQPMSYADMLCCESCTV
jgi:hypothetical protein